MTSAIKTSLENISRLHTLREICLDTSVFIKKLLLPQRDYLHQNTLKVPMTISKRLGMLSTRFPANLKVVLKELFLKKGNIISREESAQKQIKIHAGLMALT